MKDNYSFAKKLAQYSSAAMTVIVACRYEAKGQIIYHDINPDTSLFISPMVLNLNNDGMLDFQLWEQVIVHSHACSWSTTDIGYLAPLNSNSIAMGSNEFADALEIGEPINENLNWQTGYGMLNMWTFTFTSCYAGGTWDGDFFGPWSSPDRYAGIALHLSDGIHYGWIRLDGGYLATAYAYESQPGVPILAGDMASCDSLEVSISPAGPITVCNGEPVELTGSVSSPFFYKWLHNGIPIFNANSLTYTATDDGTYSIVGYGGQCADTSTFVLQYFPVPSLPVISRHLDTLFSNISIGNAWYKDSDPNSVSFSNYILIDEEANYKLSYTDSNGCISGKQVFYAVPCEDLINLEFVNIGYEQNLCEGDSLFLSVKPTYYSSYQWLKFDQPIEGVTNSFYNTGETGAYSVQASYSYECLDTSGYFNLIVVDVPNPVITQSGDSLISNYTTGNQWFIDGNEIPGATNQIYHPMAGGFYQVRVIDVNECSGISSSTYYTNVGVGEMLLPQVTIFTENNFIMVHVPENLIGSDLSIQNEIGQVLHESIISNTIERFFLHSGASGILFVIVRKLDKTTVSKIILE